MDINKLISLVGYSSINDELDDFLVESGVTKRPKSADSYPYEVKTKTPGLSLLFEDDPEGKGMRRKNKGIFVLFEIYFDFESKKCRYAGLLPFGVGQLRSSSEVVDALRPNVPTDIDTSDDELTVSFYLDGLVITFCYSDLKGLELRFVRVSLKDKFHVMHGLAPAEG